MLTATDNVLDFIGAHVDTVSSDGGGVNRSIGEEGDEARHLEGENC